jgi:glycosyltransferase involved in cell wall biosynthesis
MQVAGAEVLVAETIHRLGSRIEPVIFCLDEVGALGERVRREGVEVLAFGRRPGLDLSVSWRMAKEIRRRELDVIHAHQYTPFFYSAIAGRLSGSPPRLIFTEHGRHFPDVVPLRRRIANRLLFGRLADRINAVSEFSARSLRERDGFSRTRIDVIQNGVDSPRYGGANNRAAVRARLGLERARRYIAAVARFHPVKDHRTLLRAFADVAHSKPDVDLLLVGDGPLRGELERLTHELKISDRTRFLGVRDDVADILRAADVFALTSLSEAASITLLEAMASETPVVATAVGGNPEIVRDGIDGLLVPRRDPSAIATALIRVLDDPRMARAMGLAAAERVRSQFCLERTVEQYYGLYLALSNGRRAPYNR